MSEVLAPLRVSRPVHGGYCLAHTDGTTVFVAGALPDETVVARVRRRRKRVCWAEVIDVVEASPDRREHVWADAAGSGAGGADLGHVRLAASRRWKAQVIEDALRRLGSPELAEAAGGIVVEAAPGDVARDGLGWRTRVELTVGESGLAGVYQAASHRVVAVSNLPLATDDIADLNLVGPDSPWRRLWRPGQRVRAWGRHVRIGSQWYTADGVPVAPPLLRLDVGEDTYTVHADDFWQAHREAPALLRSAVSEKLRGFAEAPMVELYCGSGLFTLPLARHARAGVLAVEGAERACIQARANVAHEAAAVDIHCDAVTPEWITSHVSQGVGVLLADPPRAGAGCDVAAAMASTHAQRIVYVACDPAALARDGEVLRRSGYAFTQLTCHDLFPYTHHVECVATLDRVL